MDTILFAVFAFAYIVLLMVLFFLGCIITIIRTAIKLPIESAAALNAFRVGPSAILDCGSSFSKTEQPFLREPLAGRAKLLENMNISLKKFQLIC